MIISISGDAGSGKSTVADIISKKLGLKSYYMGGVRRKVAKEKLGAINKLADNEKDRAKIEMYLSRLSDGKGSHTKFVELCDKLGVNVEYKVVIEKQEAE